MSSLRRLLLTGAAGTLGSDLAVALAADGWSIALVHRDERSAALNHDLAGRLSDSVRGPSPRSLQGASVHQAELSDPLAVRRLVEELEERGGVSALVHCAGSYHRRPLMEETSDDWRRCFDDNLHSAFHLCQALAPHMRRRGWGRLITFGLIRAGHLAAQPNITAQALAKGALLGLTRSFAAALAADGITANCLALGFIGEESAETTGVSETRIPAGRFGAPGDVLAAVRFLLSEEASYVNGAEIAISGGYGI